ncbi:MAG: helix-turn-helix domain-containing protein [Spirochaetaceae bacterium]|jgi:cytoskeletal protein RodZ|nr:helix-turn-helix domain-containing protein [Spirochaetaceae bacterium]
MESLGQKLEKTRIDRGIDIEQATRETNIAKRYLEALEKEDFSLFPGEPYLIGFLRNYAEYLGLNADEVVTLYRNFRIQEQPIPLSELMPKRSLPVRPIIISAAAVVVVLAVVYVLATQLSQMKKPADETVTVRPAAEYVLESGSLTQRVYAKDVILVPLGAETYPLEVTATGPSFALQTVHGTQVVDLGEEIALDIDGLGGSDITVYVMELSKTDSSRGAEVRIAFAEETPPPAIVQNTENIPVVDSVAAVGSTGNRSTAIREFEGGYAFPVTLNVTFRGPCLFRYEIDRKDRVEDYYENGDTLIVQANNGFRLWSSNANAVKIQIIGGSRTAELEIGRPGQVLVQDINWVRDRETNTYKLVVTEVD